jgi:Uncharacterized protein conserved in bacteria
MHRSGTSLIASMLDALGVHMGDRLMPPSKANPHGYYEDMAFVKLNRSLLRQAGGSWNRPPAARSIAASPLRGNARALVRQKARRKLWGWKDPRTCLTIGLYHDALSSPRYVLVERDTDDVVASLQRRDGDGDWRGLIATYRQRVADFVAHYEPLVLALRYEDVCADPMDAARKLAQFVGADKALIGQAPGRVQ